MAVISFIITYSLVLSSIYLFAIVWRLASFMSTSLNKASHMDPHISGLSRPVTKYSAAQGSSSFSKEHWPGMDTASVGESYF